MTEIKSSTIAAVDHDGKQLTVKFRSGATYDYPDVPKELHDRMMAAHDAGESIGKFFYEHVKNGGFSFTKREDEKDGHHE
jgi:hypothetical protein